MLKRNSKGITLIVLAITIIILLILVGVTIALLTGENGILNKSTKAKNETEKHIAAEIINLKITHVQIESYSEKQKMPTLKELSLALKEDEEIQYITESSKVASVEYSVSSENPSKIYIKLKQYPYEFEINENLKLATIDGEKMDNKDDDSNNNDNTSGNIPNNNDEIQSKLAELDIAIKAIQTENEKLKTENTSIKSENTDMKNRIQTLENETIVNKRIKLMNSPVAITLPTTNWSDIDTANIQLFDSIENYKYLEIHFDYQTATQTILIATESLINNYNNSNQFTNCNESSIFYLDFNANGIDFGAACWFKNNKLLHVGPIWNNTTSSINTKIRNIYGIK